MSKDKSNHQKRKIDIERDVSKGLILKEGDRVRVGFYPECKRKKVEIVCPDGFSFIGKKVGSDSNEKHGEIVLNLNLVVKEERTADPSPTSPGVPMMPTSTENEVASSNSNAQVLMIVSARSTSKTEDK